MLRRRARVPSAISGRAPHGCASPGSAVGAGHSPAALRPISKNPDFLAARALIGWQVVALGLVLVLVPPLLALGVEAAAGLASRPLRVLLHLLFMALLVAMIGIKALKDIAPSAGS